MKTNRIIAVFGGISLMVTLLLSAVDFCCFLKPFYHSEYERGRQAERIGMSEEGLNEATDTLLDYLQDRRDDIVVETEVGGVRREVYNERETLHMEDVKDLYQKAMLVRNILACAATAAFLWLFAKAGSHFPSLLKEGLKQGLLCLLTVVCFVSVWALADFDSFWMNFHYLFFDNDLFLLDPNTSIMINMFPSSFFMHMVFLIIFVFAALAAVCFGIAVLLERRKGK